MTTGSTDTYGILEDSGCGYLASNDDYDDSKDSNFRISQPVTAGTYYVTIRHSRDYGTGSYTLYVYFSEDDYGNDYSTATAVSLNSTRGGSIETAGDIDYFRVDVTSSGTLSVSTTGSMDTYGYLENSDCNYQQVVLLKSQKIIP